ncbi:MAG: hypothetical protein JO112_15680 [Planctomycetes bacterium]|nr:hypothetical protein [Planctomycetota bacterium]
MRAEPADPDDKRLWDMLRRRHSVVFDADWWWQAITWKTAAVALQQFSPAWPGDADSVPDRAGGGRADLPSIGNRAGG